MKKLSWLLIVVLLLSACGSKEVIGEYASDKFNEKFSAYVDLYNHLLFAEDGLSKEIDRFFNQVYANGEEPDYSLPYVYQPLLGSESVMEVAEGYISKEPILETIDGHAKGSIDGSRGIIEILKEIDQAYQTNPDDVAALENLELKLSSAIDETNVSITGLNDEIERLQIESDKQMITRYESVDNLLGAEILKATLLLHRFSSAIDDYMEGQRIDTTGFTTDLNNYQGQLDRIKELSQDDGYLIKVGLDKSVVDEALGYFERAKQPMTDLLANITAQESLDDTALASFDEAFDGYIVYYNASMR